jgi:ABC-type phosphate transport system substrate-binding protein
MLRTRLRSFLLAALVAGSALVSLAQAAIVVVAHPGMRKLDVATVERIYTGRVVELDGQPVLPVNLPPQHPLRQRFLKEFVQRDEPGYLAYWTVRRYVGKGAPPREVGNSAEVLMHVLNTPGAIGYLEESDLPPGVNVVARGAKPPAVTP